MSEGTKEPAQDTTKADESKEALDEKPDGDGTPKPAGEGSDANKKDDAVTKPDSEPEKVVPEKYDFKVPEGAVGIDAKYLEQVSAYAKEHKLTQEEAQSIVNRDSANFASFVKAQNEQFASEAEKWVETAKNDKEIGGDELNRNVELAKRVVDKFGTDSFKKTLNDTGLGNHPELVRLLVRIGKTMSEDQLVVAGSQSSAKRTAVDVLYGKKQTENKGD